MRFSARFKADSKPYNPCHHLKAVTRLYGDTSESLTSCSPLASPRGSGSNENGLNLVQSITELTTLESVMRRTKHESKERKHLEVETRLKICETTERRRQSAIVMNNNVANSHQPAAAVINDIIQDKFLEWMLTKKQKKTISREVSRGNKVYEERVKEQVSSLPETQELKRLTSLSSLDISKQFPSTNARLRRLDTPCYGKSTVDMLLIADDTGSHSTKASPPLCASPGSSRLSPPLSIFSRSSSKNSFQRTKSGGNGGEGDFSHISRLLLSQDSIEETTGIPKRTRLKKRIHLKLNQETNESENGALNILESSQLSTQRSSTGLTSSLLPLFKKRSLAFPSPLSKIEDFLPDGRMEGDTRQNSRSQLQITPSARSVLASSDNPPVLQSTQPMKIPRLISHSKGYIDFTSGSGGSNAKHQKIQPKQQRISQRGLINSERLPGDQRDGLAKVPTLCQLLQPVEAVPERLQQYKHKSIDQIRIQLRERKDTKSSCRIQNQGGYQKSTRQTASLDAQTSKKFLEDAASASEDKKKKPDQQMQKAIRQGESLEKPIINLNLITVNQNISQHPFFKYL